MIWRLTNPLLRKNDPHVGQRGQNVGLRARSAHTASTMCIARTRASGQTARSSCVSVWACSTVWSKRCTLGSSWRMLSLRHSIGNRPPFEPLVREFKSVPHFRCYASPPLTEMCARCGLLTECVQQLDDGEAVGIERGLRG